MTPPLPQSGRCPPSRGNSNLTAFPDLHFTVEQQVAEGNLICTRWRATGTHHGPLEDIEPTGKGIDITGQIISRFEGTKIAEEWEVFDELRMLQQIGVVPESGAAEQPNNRHRQPGADESRGAREAG